MKRVLQMSLPALGIVLSSAVTHAAVVSFQDGVDGYNGTQDTLIRENSGNNFGDINNFMIGQPNATTRVNRSLLSFDLSSLTGVVQSVDSATLTLTTANTVEEEGATVAFYAIADTDAGWTEAGADWYLKEQDDPNSEWSSPGGGPAGEGNTTLLGTATLPAALTTFDVDLDAATALHWINNTNAGILIRYLNEENGAGERLAETYFRASDFGTATVRPKLTMEYTPIPEPASLGLLLGGAVLLATRRSR